MQYPSLLALLVVGSLLAASPAIAQHPSATARPHPAPSAHANAIAGQASATRIEACTEATASFLDELTAGNFKAATGNFDAKLQAALGSAKLGEVWQAVGAHYGKLQSRGAAQNMIYQDFAVITVPLRFANGVLGARLACGADGRFAGFHLVPVPSAAPAGSG